MPALSDKSADAGILNAMTIDVEDYFQVSAFSGSVRPADWDRYESRVVANTERLLELFAAYEVVATFFVLGWVAERFPQLVRRIAAQGHELASHGYSHGLAYEDTPEGFRTDLRRARLAIEQASGSPVFGYRAPSFSITRRSLWAFDVLIDEGYLFDSSIYPIHHDRYGIPDWARHPHKVERAGGTIWELPGSTIELSGTNLPVGGGGYFRLLPYWWTKHGISRLNDTEGIPAIFYLHPWEIDPGQPRLPGSLPSRFRHYCNLRKTEGRLRRLLTDFRFGPVTQILSEAQTRVALPAESGGLGGWKTNVRPVGDF